MHHHPHQPGQIFPSRLNVRQKSAIATLRVLCGLDTEEGRREGKRYEFLYPLGWRVHHNFSDNGYTQKDKKRERWLQSTVESTDSMVQAHDRRLIQTVQVFYKVASLLFQFVLWCTVYLENFDSACYLSIPGSPACILYFTPSRCSTKFHLFLSSLYFGLYLENLDCLLSYK